jgi:hypothetical protein
MTATRSWPIDWPVPEFIRFRSLIEIDQVATLNLVGRILFDQIFLKHYPEPNMLSLIKAATVVFMIYVRDFGRSILIEHNNNNKSCFMINAHATVY